MVANKMYFQHAPKGNYLPVTLRYWYCTWRLKVFQGKL